MKRGLIIAAAALAAVLAGGTAEARNVSIYQCGYYAPDGMWTPADTDLVTPGPASTIAFTNRCGIPPTGEGGLYAKDRGLWLTSPAAAGTSHAAGQRGSFTVRSAGRTEIVTMESVLDRQVHNYDYVSGTGDPRLESWALGYRLSETGGTVLENCGAVTAPGPTTCNPTGEAEVRDARFGGPAEIPGVGQAAYLFEFGCFGTVEGRGCRAIKANPSLRVTSLKLRVNDPEPAQATAMGPLADPGRITHPDPYLHLNASDEGGLGVHRAYLQVDGITHSDVVFRGRACDEHRDGVWLAGQPCPTSPPTQTMLARDLGHELPEGRHDLKLTVWDAGLNRRVVFDNRGVLVDRIPAPTPGEGALAPRSSGHPSEGSLLTAQPGQWDGHGLEVTFAYQWRRCDRSGTQCTDIPGAVAEDYRLTDVDAGQQVGVTVIGRSGEGDTPVPLPTVGPVSPLPPPTAGTPAIAGQPIQGSVVEARPGSWNGHGLQLSYAYQWQRCSATGSDCTDVSGATEPQFRLGAGDVDRTVRVRVTGTTTKGSASATSKPFGPVGGLLCAGSRCEETPETAQPVDSSTAQAATTEAPAAPDGPNGRDASRHVHLTAGGPGDRRVVRVPYRARVALTGRLTDRRGTPIAGAVLDVLSRPAVPGSAFERIGTGTTAPDGTFRHFTAAGPGRVIRFAYRAFAGDIDYAADRDVELVVKAAVDFAATRHVRAGRPIEFAGAVPGIRRGTRVELQAKDGRRWRTFQTVPTDARGRYRSRYTVRRVPGPLSFLFRVRYRANASIPLESATSRVIRVRVRP